MTRDQAVIHFGSQAALARALGIGKAAVNAWRDIPIDRQCQIEVITAGKLVADRGRLGMVERRASGVVDGSSKQDAA